MKVYNLSDLRKNHQQSKNLINLNYFFRLSFKDKIKLFKDPSQTPKVSSRSDSLIDKNPLLNKETTYDNERTQSF